MRDTAQSLQAIGASIRENRERLRVLVAIASYGEKNLQFLRQIIQDYRRMSMTIDLIVHSNAPKEVDGEVKVIVGLPERNPHSLPFAHKQTFAENVDRYDLFIYSEDDIGVRQHNIEEFLRASAVLASDEIAGHVRYEVSQDGTLYLPDVHGSFHWKPESVRRRGGYTVAEFTNEHAGFYILTQAQLRSALLSGNYLCKPYEGRYGMLETAATDPYTRCGFRKVICISAFDDFLIHHMPNRYVGTIGISMPAFKEQIQRLTDIRDGVRSAITLCEVEPKLLQRNWSKSYYEPPEHEVLRMVPENATTILSVGSGWGATELRLKLHGYRVTALPLDSIISTSLECHGIEMIHGTLNDCLRSLHGRSFDCVLMPNLLHLLSNPSPILRDYASLVSDRGHFIMVGYNFNFLPYLIKRQLGIAHYRHLDDFAQSGVHLHRISIVKRELRDAGFDVEDLRWFEPLPAKPLSSLRRWPGQLTKRNWVLKARRLT